MGESISTELAKKYLAGNCTADEIKLVHEWFNSFDKLTEAVAGLSEAKKQKLEDKLFSSILENIEEKTASETSTVDRLSGRNERFTGMFQLKIAAIFVLVLLTFITYKKFVAHPPTPAIAKNNKSKINDFAPGGSKAVLTLANGSKIILDNAPNGVLAKNGHISIKKTKNGRLVYTVASNTKANSEINTLETPIGGQYEVLLPDGTHAWLNSKSSLKFPTTFQSGERRVEISGEIYFEVAKNKLKPFIVHSDSTLVEVLGTHFNVMAYPNEIKTATLLEGSIKISNGKVTHLLKPGEQAVVKTSGQMKVNDNVNLAEVVAWKNGFFEFNNTDIQTIMREASRWYGINVTYKNSEVHTRYTGRISREVNLSELLSMLKYTGLVYQMKGADIVIEE